METTLQGRGIMYNIAFLAEISGISNLDGVTLNESLQKRSSRILYSNKTSIFLVLMVMRSLCWISI